VRDFHYYFRGTENSFPRLFPRLCDINFRRTEDIKVRARGDHVASSEARAN
jgi:hypothetical protein